MQSRLLVMVSFGPETPVLRAPCLPSAPCSPFPGMLPSLLVYILLSASGTRMTSKGTGNLAYFAHCYVVSI